MTTDSFIATVRKYTRAKKLTPRMLSELIDRVAVHDAKKVDGIYVQKLTIYYNCVGTLEIPDKEHLEKPSIIMQTRKGIAVSYAPSQNEHKKAGRSYSIYFKDPVIPMVSGQLTSSIYTRVHGFNYRE